MGFIPRIMNDSSDTVSTFTEQGEYAQACNLQVDVLKGYKLQGNELWHIWPGKNILDSSKYTVNREIFKERSHNTIFHNCNSESHLCVFENVIFQSMGNGVSGVHGEHVLSHVAEDKLLEREHVLILIPPMVVWTVLELLVNLEHAIMTRVQLFHLELM